MGVGRHDDLATGKHRQHRVAAHVAVHEGYGRHVLQLAVEQKISQFLTGSHFPGGADSSVLTLSRAEVVNDEMDGPFLALRRPPGLGLDRIDDVAVDRIANGNEQTILARGRLRVGGARL